MRTTEQSSGTTVSRRGFLGSGIAAAGALSVPHVQRVFGQSDIAPSVRLTAAVIGAGGIAHFHAAHQINPWFEVRAVCDVDRSRGQMFVDQRTGGRAGLHEDYRELLDREDIDVFFVTTPDHWHTKISVDAMRAGKDVYCEKPLTLTIDEGRLIRKVEQETGRVIQVGTQQRSDPSFQTAVALAHSGRLGALKRVTVAIGGGSAGGPFEPQQVPEGLNWDRWLGQAPETPYIPQRTHGTFRWWYEYSGGKMTDWGAHHVDIAQWAIDPEGRGPESIEVVESHHPVPLEGGMPTDSRSFNTATSFRVRCQFAGGVELIIRENAEDLGFENGLLFECEQGRYFVNRNKLTGKPIEQLQEKPLPEESLAALRKGRPVMNHVENFYRCCRERTEPLSDVASHMRSLTTCHLANIAMRLGRTLQWDGGLQTVTNDAEANQWQSRKQRAGYEIV